MKLESLDLRILRVLMEDGRASFRQIAAKLGVSTPTISARVKELEMLGVLDGYRAVVRPEKLGGLTLFIRVKVEQGALRDVVGELSAMEEVRQLHLISRLNLLVRAVFMGVEEMQDFLKWVSGLVGIVEYEDYALLETHKDESPVLIKDGVSLAVDCFYCGKKITEKPIKLRLDDRYHYLCCTSCANLYREKYEKMKRAAQSPVFLNQ
ncbi:MAG: AsnC family transcriptional regulator [Thermoplasmata archaeon]